MKQRTLIGGPWVTWLFSTFYWLLLVRTVYNNVTLKRESLISYHTFIFLIYILSPALILHNILGFNIVLVPTDSYRSISLSKTSYFNGSLKLGWLWVVADKQQLKNVFFRICMDGWHKSKSKDHLNKQYDETIILKH